MDNDYYDTLNVPSNAPQGSIARAAQARLREIADDLDMPPEEKPAAAAAVHHAQDILGDVDRRAQYDIELQNQREESARPKPVVKKQVQYSYPKIGLAFAILFAVSYFSIDSYFVRQHRLEAEQAAIAQAEAKKLADIEADRRRRAALREEEKRLLAEQKKMDQQRMLSERGFKDEGMQPEVTPAKK